MIIKGDDYELVTYHNKYKDSQVQGVNETRNKKIITNPGSKNQVKKNNYK